MRSKPTGHSQPPFTSERHPQGALSASPPPGSPTFESRADAGFWGGQGRRVLHRVRAGRPPITRSCAQSAAATAQHIMIGVGVPEPEGAAERRIFGGLRNATITCAPLSALARLPTAPGSPATSRVLFRRPEVRPQTCVARDDNDSRNSCLITPRATRSIAIAQTRSHVVPNDARHRSQTLGAPLGALAPTVPSRSLSPSVGRGRRCRRTCGHRSNQGCHPPQHPRPLQELPPALHRHRLRLRALLCDILQRFGVGFLIDNQAILLCNAQATGLTASLRKPPTNLATHPMIATAGLHRARRAHVDGSDTSGLHCMDQLQTAPHARPPSVVRPLRDKSFRDVGSAGALA